MNAPLRKRLAKRPWFRQMTVSDMLAADVAFGAASELAIARLTEAGRTPEEARSMVEEASAGYRGWEKIKAVEGLTA